MDRRAALRALLLGVAGSSGCLTNRSADPETTASESDRTMESTSPETRPTATETTLPEGRTTVEPTTTERTTDACPPSAVPAKRVHEHSDYGLGIVRESTDGTAVAVVGEEWRSALETEAMSGADEEFVSATDFEASCVLVVQYTKSSSGHGLRVTGLEIDEDTVDADVCVVGPGGANDSPTANLFVRVPYSGPPPSKARLRLETPVRTVTVSSE